MHYFLDLHFDEEDNAICEILDIKTLEKMEVPLSTFNELVEEEKIVNCSIQI